jgi:hypothetical protein
MSRRNARRVDSRYVFTIVTSDGVRRRRGIYWQRLYAFRLGYDQVLAAGHMVPYSGELFALYTILRNRRPRLDPGLLPALATGPSTANIIRAVAEIIPARVTELARQLDPDTRLALQEAVEQAIAPYAAEIAQPSPFDEPDLTAPGARPRPGGGPLSGLLGGLTEGDVTPVNASFQVDAAIRDRIGALTAREGGARRALARRRKTEEQLYESLYTDARFLRFVQWVMEAGGSLVSPVVRGFLRFYYRALLERMDEAGADPVFRREALDAALGQAEAEVSKTLPYFDLTVLGRVVEGDVPIDRDDPQHTGHSFRVAPGFHPGDVVVRELASRPERLLLRTLIASHFRPNIKRLRFVGTSDWPELHGRESRVGS